MQWFVGGRLTTIFILLLCTSGASQIQSPPQFRGGVTLVPVEVRVVDKTGAPVTDLTPVGVGHGQVKFGLVADVTQRSFGDTGQEPAAGGFGVRRGQGLNLDALGLERGYQFDGRAGRVKDDAGAQHVAVFVAQSDNPVDPGGVVDDLVVGSV